MVWLSRRTQRQDERIDVLDVSCIRASWVLSWMTGTEIPSMHGRANMPLVSCACLLPKAIRCVFYQKVKIMPIEVKITILISPIFLP